MEGSRARSACMRSVYLPGVSVTRRLLSVDDFAAARPATLPPFRIVMRLYYIGDTRDQLMSAFDPLRTFALASARRGEC